MNAVFSITLLLLSFSAVKTWEPLEVQNEEGVGFTPLSEKRALRTEEFPGACRACKAVVSFVRKKLGHDHSKEKIRQLLNNACNGIKIRLVRSACKSLIRKYIEKLIDVLANGGCARSTCVKLKMCKNSS